MDKLDRLTQRNAGGISRVCHHYEPEERLCYGCVKRAQCNAAIFERLAAYEETGLTPEQIQAAKETLECFDNIGIKRGNEIVRAEQEGRLVILPCGDHAELVRDGETYQGDHWNHTLSAFRDDPTTPSGRRVALFSIEEAERALKGGNDHA